MLSEGIAARRGRYGAYIHRDRVNRKLRPRRGSRLAAITSGGAIPETALFTVVASRMELWSAPWTKTSPSKAIAGDIMLLGNTSWRIRRVEGISGRVLVEDAHGRRRMFPSGVGKRRHGHRNFPPTSPVAQGNQRPAAGSLPGWISQSQPAGGANRRLVERRVRAG